MRVVSGSARGTKLLSLEGDHTRPTIDRVKEAMFSMIQNEIYAARVLDLFSGSGALGIEAISRGAEHADFVELNAKANQMVKQNIEKCHFKDKTQVYQQDVNQFLAKQGPQSYDLILLDPPYQKGFVKKTFDRIVQYDILKINGIILLEHHRQDEEATMTYEGLERIKNKHYGIVGVSVFRRI